MSSLPSFAFRSSYTASKLAVARALGIPFASGLLMDSDAYFGGNAPLHPGLRGGSWSTAALITLAWLMKRGTRRESLGCIPDMLEDLGLPQASLKVVKAALKRARRRAALQKWSGNCKFPNKRGYLAAAVMLAHSFSPVELLYTR